MGKASDKSYTTMDVFWLETGRNPTKWKQKE
jgi:hypothetical protein